MLLLNQEIKKGSFLTCRHKVMQCSISKLADIADWFLPNPETALCTGQWSYILGVRKKLETEKYIKIQHTFFRIHITYIQTRSALRIAWKKQRRSKGIIWNINQVWIKSPGNTVSWKLYILIFSPNSRHEIVLWISPKLERFIHCVKLYRLNILGKWKMVEVRAEIILLQVTTAKKSKIKDLKKS